MRLLALLVLVAVSCSRPTAPSRSEAPYILRTVNGDPLPVTVWEFTVLSGSIFLRADSTFTDRVEYRYGGAAYVDSLVGRYRRSGDSLTFVSDDYRAVYRAGFDGTRLVVTAWGFVEEYTR